MKTALVCGAGGFIGAHLVDYLQKQGYRVRGVDVKKHEFRDKVGDEFLICDLRDISECRRALTINKDDCRFDEVYQLAADMGGMGFIHSAECDIMYNSALININMIKAATEMKCPRYFYSSSACVYPDMRIGAQEMVEEQVYPAMPDNEYGWEKLYAERMAMAFSRHHNMPVRIARFQNCFGPYGTWDGGREKAPAAICRKVAQAQDGDSIDVWGDGRAMRSYTYVDDMVDGIYKLMHSNIDVPVNIGNPEYVSVTELVDIVCRAAGKKVNINYVDGPVGVMNRNFSNSKIETTGWTCKHNTYDGILKTYPWIEQQVKNAK